MRINRPKNSIKLKTWVRPWMAWSVCFLFVFTPSLIACLIRSPYYSWLEAWDDFKREYDPLDFRDTRKIGANK